MYFCSKNGYDFLFFISKDGFLRVSVDYGTVHYMGDFGEFSYKPCIAVPHNESVMIKIFDIWAETYRA